MDGLTPPQRTAIRNKVKQMKRVILATAMLAMAFITSCRQSDDTEWGVEQESNVNIAVTLPTQINAVRSQDNPGAGDMVNRCIMEVYLDGEIYGERQVAAITDDKTASFSMRLVSGKEYKFVFWADCAEGSTPENFSDLYYATSDLSNVYMIDPAHYDGSNDERDAFYAVEDVEITASQSFGVDLKRPFGQLNVKTLDMDQVPDAMQPTHVSVAFEQIPTAINLLTGELTEVTGGIEYNENANVVDATNGVLSFDYIFAPKTEGEQYLTDFTMSFLDESGKEVASPYEFSSIPVQRNYRTVVSGNLLTKQADITVEVKPGFADGDIEHDVFEASTIEQLNQALAAGAENVTLTQAPESDAEIIIPHDYDVEDKGIVISLPATDKQITLNYAAEEGYAPERISINPDGIGNLVINAKESTVTVDGTMQNVTAATAENTFIVAENATIANLTINKGSLKLYGVVEALTKGQSAGKVYRCFDSQKSFDNLVADNVSGYEEILVENPATEEIDGKGAAFTRQMTVSAPVTAANFRIDVDYAGAYGLKVIEGANKVEMDNIVVTSTAKASRTVWIEAETTDCHFSNSTFTVPVGTSDRSGLNCSVMTSSTVQNVSLDNVLISIDEERLNVDPATDYSYSDEQKNRVPSYSRGITIGYSGTQDISNAVVNITMNNSAIEYVYYAINVVQTKGSLNLEANNCVFDGRAALNLWGQSAHKQDLNIRNSKLIGRNWFGGPTEVFATMVINYQARNYNILLDNCDVVSDNNPQTNTNYQYMASFRSPIRNWMTITNGTRFRETSNPRLMHAIDIDDDSWINEINWDDTFTLECAEGATVLVSNVWNGSKLEDTAMPSEQDGKYYIGTPTQLANWVSEKIGGDAVLVRDLDLNGLAWPVSTTADPIVGSFDGNGHTIRNLNCQTYLVEADGTNGLAWDNKAQNAALFPIFSGDIRNLTIDGATIYGSRSGALVGRFNGGTIDNCHVKNVEITGGAQKVAALVGYAANYTDAAFTNCSVVNANIAADKNAPAGDASCMAGGFIGYLSSDGVSVTINDNSITDVTVESGNLWDTEPRCASHVFVANVINISKTTKGSVSFSNNKINNCKLLNANVTSLATDFFGFYYTNPTSDYPILNTLTVNGKTLVE